MATPNTPLQSAQPAVPKGDNARAASPPPAYMPRMTIAPVSHQIPGYQIQHLFPQADVQQMNYIAAQAAAAAAAAAQEDEGSADKCPISLRINSSVNISRNNNIVCLEASPADYASNIASAIAKSLLEGSSGRCGIPMIDENGVPRPLLIEVDASMVVQGANNIVGNHDAISQVLAAEPNNRRRPREDDKNNNNNNNGDDESAFPAPPANKRRRASQ